VNNSEPENNKESKRYSVIKEHVHTDQCNHTNEAEELDEHCFYKGGALSHELFSHLPFSVLSVTIGILIAGLICFVISPETMQEANTLLEQTHDHNHAVHESHGSHLEGEGTEHLNHDHEGHDHSSNKEDSDDGSSPIGFLFLFHLFHPAHILFSALATTAMFYKYDKNLFKAIIIGFFGSIAFCTVSDAVIPTFTARMIGYDAPIHLCILETPMQILPFAIIGVLLGLASVISGSIKSTISSHSVHVATSTMATIFYMIAYSNKLDWINSIGTVFMMTVLAVGGICCLSDVIFPMMFTKDARKEYGKYGHEHPH
jgi:hypothetical protein